MIKIGIVFFDDIHIIPHFIGLAAELYNDPECEVDILTPEMDYPYLNKMVKKLGMPETVIKKLPTYLYKKIAYKIQGRTKPSNQYVFKKNMKKLLDYDVLVFNVFNQGHIKRKNRDKPKFVFLMHGAGDSYYPFTEDYYDIISEYSLVTTAGQKINDLFATMGEFKDTKFEICGYQKLDVIDRKPAKLFDNNNPIVLYNPHFRPHLSSFLKFHQQVLEFFYQNKDYNLIFAPHMNLFTKKTRQPLSRDIIDKKYINAPNILVDFGSEKSVDMTYTVAADVFLGDVSSQVYEFLLQGPKPAIFINAHDFDWEDDIHFQNWHLGKVINNIDNLREILDTRDEWQKEYEEKQRKAIAYTFDIDPNKSSAKRAAEAIKKLVKKDK